MEACDEDLKGNRRVVSWELAESISWRKKSTVSKALSYLHKKDEDRSSGQWIGQDEVALTLTGECLWSGEDGSTLRTD